MSCTHLGKVHIAFSVKPRRAAVTAEMKPARPKNTCTGMYAARKGDCRPGKKNVMKPETHCEVIKDMIWHESLCVYYSYLNTEFAVHS